jgi:DNA-binding CsgD family transcriptional regulator
MAVRPPEGAVAASARLAPDWPLVGRDEELALLRRLRQGRTPRSAVVNGAAGVGKSRLAREALQEADAEGWATLEVRASAGLTGVPLAPLRRLLTTAAPDSLQELVSAVERDLVAMRSRRGLLVLVDDAHELDASSAGLLHQLVSLGTIAVILTTRGGTTPPAAVTDLWKDGFAERFELQELSRRQTASLLAHVLGNPPEESSADRIWHVTEGNPLFVREVVLASIEAGAMRLVDGAWRWRGEWASGGRLREIVAGRIGALDPDELTVVELLAVGGALPLELVTGLANGRALRSLDARGLVRIERRGRRLEASMAHPVYAEVTRGTMTALQQRSVRCNLVDALRRTPSRRSDDRLRLAWWSLESGLEVDPVTLALGADALVFKLGHAIAGRLDELLGTVPQEAPWQTTPERGNAALVIRLARAAYEARGGMAEGAGLARALAWTGDTDGAEQVLAELAGRSAPDEDRVRLALARGWIRFWGRHDVAGAEAVLEEAIRSAGDCPPDIVADAHQQLAGIALNVARPAEALAHAERMAAYLGLPLVETIASPAAAASLAYLGRCDESLALIDLAIATASNGTGPHPLTVPTLLFCRAGTLARMGRFEEARTLAESCRDVALATDSLDEVSMFGTLLGEILLREGRPASAGRLFRDAAGLLATRDVRGYRPWALTGLARVKAATGDVAGAAACLAQAREVQAIPRHFDVSLHLAEIDVAAMEGAPGAARAAGEAGVAWARAAGMPIDEALILDAMVRVEPERALADRLSELAEVSDSALVAALAEHGRALVGEDAEGLERAAGRFEAMSATWLAAEAYAAAALAHRRRGRERPAQASVRKAFELAARCEGARTVYVAILSAPSSLTRREGEVARLAAEGLSSRQIADKLYLSARTVESHLHHAYTKLGVNDRAGLAEALAGGA